MANKIKLFIKKNYKIILILIFIVIFICYYHAPNLKNYFGSKSSFGNVNNISGTVTYNTQFNLNYLNPNGNYRNVR